MCHGMQSHMEHILYHQLRKPEHKDPETPLSEPFPSPQPIPSPAGPSEAKQPQQRLPKTPNRSLPSSPEAPTAPGASPSTTQVWCSPTTPTLPKGSETPGPPPTMGGSEPPKPPSRVRGSEQCPQAPGEVLESPLPSARSELPPDLPTRSPNTGKGFEEPQILPHRAPSSPNASPPVPPQLHPPVTPVLVLQSRPTSSHSGAPPNAPSPSLVLPQSPTCDSPLPPAPPPQAAQFSQSLLSLS